ncbi:hypothetical protein RB199_37735 [Streptomyces libani]|uniref:Uncharacterized protein n=1 Tax=Streptomyces nigrescens TaxID=1920 RepID=A0ABY7I702_STRNI|nr:hypothetical protein [Streptomyces libani]WAT94450.1 hypothetical protein STRLI_000056 [Streptomyces libani subsp. libani]
MTVLDAAPAAGADVSASVGAFAVAVAEATLADGDDAFVVAGANAAVVAEGAPGPA